MSWLTLAEFANVSPLKLGRLRTYRLDPELVLATMPSMFVGSILVTSSISLTRDRDAREDGPTMTALFVVSVGVSP